MQSCMSIQLMSLHVYSSMNAHLFPVIFPRIALSSRFFFSASIWSWHTWSVLLMLFKKINVGVVGRGVVDCGSRVVGRGSRGDWDHGGNTDIRGGSHPPVHITWQDFQASVVFTAGVHIILAYWTICTGPTRNSSSPFSVLWLKVRRRRSLSENAFHRTCIGKGRVALTITNKDTSEHYNNEFCTIIGSTCIFHYLYNVFFCLVATG